MTLHQDGQSVMAFVEIHRFGNNIDVHGMGGVDHNAAAIWSMRSGAVPVSKRTSHYLWSHQAYLNWSLRRHGKKIGEQTFVNQSIALRDRPDYQKTLANYDASSLILCGREGLLCPLERYELMRNLIKGSTLKIVDHAGHLPTLEQPEAVNQAVDDWLRE